MIAASLLAAAAPAGQAPPARGLPVHLLDERQAGRTILVEAGDRIVIRLGLPWRPAGRHAAPLVAIAASAAGAPGTRSFAYQLRRAGAAELVFNRPGSPAVLRFRIVAH